jgi:hypothetical protein
MSASALFSGIVSLLPMAFGAAVFCGALYFAWYAQTYSWRQAQTIYAGSHVGPKQTRWIVNMILRGGPKRLGWKRWFWSSYSGITSISASPAGLSLKLIPPFGIGCKPMFIPAAEWRAESCDWYLNTLSYAIIGSRLKNYEFIIDHDLMLWINIATGRDGIGDA